MLIDRDTQDSLSHLKTVIWENNSNGLTTIKYHSTSGIWFNDKTLFMWPWFTSHMTCNVIFIWSVSNDAKFSCYRSFQQAFRFLSHRHYHFLLLARFAQYHGNRAVLSWLWNTEHLRGPRCIRASDSDSDSRLEADTAVMGLPADMRGPDPTSRPPTRHNKVTKLRFKTNSSTTAQYKRIDMSSII